MKDFHYIKEHGIVAIIRGQKQENILPIIEALWKGGIRIAEITADTPGITAALRETVDEFGEEMLIGAGTVLDPETAKSVIDSGAKFIISPTLNTDTIRLTKRYGLMSIPAAMTPTEMLSAYEAGADLIKLFPAGSLGPDYIKAVKGPLPQIPIMPTGGIDVNNMETFFKAGAAAVGIGGSLVRGNMEVTKESLEALTAKARLYADTFAEIKKNKDKVSL